MGFQIGHGNDRRALTGQFVPCTIGPVKTVSEIFDCWDTVPEMADDVGEHQWTVRKWKARKRIPQTAWGAVISALERKGKKLSADSLLRLHGSATSSNAAACK